MAAMQRRRNEKLASEMKVSCQLRYSPRRSAKDVQSRMQAIPKSSLSDQGLLLTMRAVGGRSSSSPSPIALKLAGSLLALAVLGPAFFLTLGDEEERSEVRSLAGSSESTSAWS